MLAKGSGKTRVGASENRIRLRNPGNRPRRDFPTQLNTMLGVMSMSKATALAVGITIFYFVLMVISFAFTGAGHGSGFFGAALLAPFSGVFFALGFALWPVVAFLVAFRHRFRLGRFIAAGILIVHYLGIARLCYRTDGAEWNYVGKVWRSAGDIVLIFLILYLGSQIFFWLMIARRKHDT